MKLNAEINLDDVFTGSEWSETIGQIIRDELKLAIKAELKREIKNDKHLVKVITEYKKRAIAEAEKALGM